MDTPQVLRIPGAINGGLQNLEFYKSQRRFRACDFGKKYFLFSLKKARIK